MSLQKECRVQNPLSNQPAIAGSEHNLATQCANPLCSKELLYFREGTLKLLELESHSDNRVRPDDGAFAMSSSPSRFFWLCGDCTKTHIITRWTTAGPVLVLRGQAAAGSRPNLAARPAADATTRPLPVSLTMPLRPPMRHPLQEKREPGKVQPSICDGTFSSH